MDLFIHFIKALPSTLLPFEVDDDRRNQTNYGLFMIHYYEYYSKLSFYKQLVNAFSQLCSSDLESIHSSEDEGLEEVDDEVHDDMQKEIFDVMKKMVDMHLL